MPLLCPSSAALSHALQNADRGQSDKQICIDSQQSQLHVHQVSIRADGSSTAHAATPSALL